MINFGAVPIGAVLPVFFDSYAGATGASITLTGLAVTDIEIYKGTSMTQRSSDAGYVLLDTDGIDIDTITGIHGFSIDTGDNTDAGFYASGSFYTVVVSAVTIDAQTVNFVAATFRCVTAEGIAGQPKVDVAALLGTAWLTPGTAGTPDVNTKLVGGTAQTGGDLKTLIDAVDNFVDTEVADIQARLPAALVGGRMDASVGAVAAGAIGAAGFAANAIDAAALAADASTEIKNTIFAATLTELAADPGASPELQKALALLYMAVRNLRTTTATADTIANNAGVTVLTAAVSDDGTTFSKAKYA